VLFSQVREIREMPEPVEELDLVLEPLLADASAAATYEHPRV
jgi:hypothetical protein